MALAQNSKQRLPYMLFMSVSAVYALYIAGLILCLAR